MQDLKIWEEKIKEKRKSTEFRDFVKEICSFSPLHIYKINGFLSKFPSSDRIYGVQDGLVFEENRDTLTNKGEEYDFSKNFFLNYKNLFQSINLPALMIQSDVENANYADSINSSKNVYLSFIVVMNCENVLYSYYIKHNGKNVLNSVMVWNSCENIYFCSGIINSFNIFYSRYIYHSSNTWFSRNLVGCSECIFCENLENKSYCINNQELEKSEYFTRKKQILKQKKEFINWYKNSNTGGMNMGSEKILGNFVLFSENIQNGYFVNKVKNGKNLIISGGNEDFENMYDTFCCGGISDFYGVFASGRLNENIYCSGNIEKSSNIFYSYFCNDCSFCLGCIGLKNKSFCILNKQYSKEEWQELSNKIFATMEEDGTLGEFFPGEINPFYFNDTMAYFIDDSFTKEEVEKEGFMWREEKVKVDIPEGAEVVYSTPPARSSLPPQSRGTQGGLNDYQGFDSSGNWKINPEILKKVIVDKNGDYYRIIKQEYDFLVKHELPLPEIHWLERIKLSLKFN
ncbi:hypothetical protein HGA92_05750 [Candidatus Gracilibacteria bacterium]|nr:hypothetical protein [Candidatus Gracilibacteria bacterium]NUJ98635.1 hypothetical protein [Candidatus Gracilibacteria bacterium]